MFLIGGKFGGFGLLDLTHEWHHELGKLFGNRPQELWRIASFLRRASIAPPADSTQPASRSNKSGTIALFTFPPPGRPAYHGAAWTIFSTVVTIAGTTIYPSHSDRRHAVWTSTNYTVVITTPPAAWPSPMPG